MQQLTKAVRFKIGGFVAIALFGTSYIGATLIGFNPFAAGYTVTVALPDGGGLFVNSEVTHRGFQVGEVTDLRPADDGVTAVVQIAHDAPDIPADVSVRVRARSAIGEQYLDLRGSASDEHLADGDHLVGGLEAMPPDVADLLQTARDFSASIPSDSLKTVVDETYLLSQGVGDDLGRLIELSGEFQKAADKNFLLTKSLIKNSEQVLRTQEASSDALLSYSKDLAVIAATLKDSDADLRGVMANAPGAAHQLSVLMRDVGQPLGTLMSNLVSTATIFGVHSDGVRSAMIRVPEAISIGESIHTSRGLRMGMVSTFFDPLPCTRGYESTQKRRGTDTSSGRPLNTKAGCAHGARARAVPEIRNAGSLEELLGGQS